ncbi:MAG TPA: nucleoside hydrolase [Myxococcota bacterium]|nr:nucleoside hydrolase [Myxococcota bacterium]
MRPTAALLAAACAHHTTAPAPERVWLDVDPSIGLPGKDIDDGVATLLAFVSPEVEVVGVSVVYGNAPVDLGLPIALEMAALRGPPGLPVVAGAPGVDLRPARDGSGEG